MSGERDMWRNDFDAANTNREQRIDAGRMQSAMGRMVMPGGGMNSLKSIFETPTIQSWGDMENQGRMQRMLNDERFRQAMSQNPHSTGNQYPQQAQQQAPQGPMRSITPQAPQDNFMNSLREQMMLRQFQSQIQDGQGGGQVPAYVQPKYQNQANPYTPRVMQLNSGDTNNLRQYMGVGR